MYEALSTRGYLVYPGSDENERDAAKLLDMIFLGFMLVVGGMLLVTFGRLSRHRSNIRVAEWLMKEVASTVESNTSETLTHRKGSDGLLAEWEMEIAEP